MRILHILAADATNSIKNRFVDMVGAFVAIGIEQYAIIAPDETVETRLDAMSIPFEIQKFSGLFDLRSKKEVKGRAQTFQPHIVQSHSAESAFFAAETKGHGVHVAFLGNDDGDAKILSMCKTGLLEGAPQDGGDENTQIIKVPPLMLADAPGRNDLSLRKNYDTPGDFILLGTVCSADKKSGLDKIFQALREIQKTHLWVLTDYGQDRDGYVDLVEKLAVQDKVRLLPPETPQAAFIGALDILVLPPGGHDRDRQTVTAWSLEKVPLFVGPFEDTIISNRETGLVTGSVSTLKIREDLQKLVDDSELGKKIASNGKQVFDSQYKPEIVIGRYLKAYARSL